MIRLWVAAATQLFVAMTPSEMWTTRLALCLSAFALISLCHDHLSSSRWEDVVPPPPVQDVRPSRSERLSERLAELLINAEVDLRKRELDLYRQQRQAAIAAAEAEPRRDDVVEHRRQPKETP